MHGGLLLLLLLLWCCIVFNHTVLPLGHSPTIPLARQCSIGIMAYSSLVGRQLRAGNPPFRSIRAALSCWRPGGLKNCIANTNNRHHGNLSFFSSSTTTETMPWKVAIVGSGPSGCYTAKYLQSSKQASFAIDILERLPTAYGLVRNGVAPDHPEVKNVQNDFDAMMMDENDPSSNIQFFGNVHVGQDVSLTELRSMYDMVVLAYGCESDRILDLSGSINNLKGILSARQFVAWYNGHVDYDWVGPVVQEALSSGSSTKNHIVVLGHGNVALDCARILAKTREELDPTDIATRALDILDPPTAVGEEETERIISVVGRRGHVQGAFTIKELRELTKLPYADFVVRTDELEMGKSSEACQEELKSSRPRTRMDKLLTEAASQTDKNKKFKPNRRQVHLRFLLNPARFEAVEDDPSKLGRVVCERTRLDGEVGEQRAVGTGQEESLEAQLALVSIGYKGVAIPGTEPWFEEAQGVLRNTHGKVDGVAGELGGLYTSGWLKRGPSGIIGTNIPDAKDTVATMLHDAEIIASPKEVATTSLKTLLEERGVAYVDWDAYRRIDAAEMKQEHKRNPEQPREKFTTTQQLLQAAKKESSSSPTE